MNRRSFLGAAVGGSALLLVPNTTQATPAGDGTEGGYLPPRTTNDGTGGSDHAAFTAREALSLPADDPRDLIFFAAYFVDKQTHTRLGTDYWVVDATGISAWGVDEVFSMFEAQMSPKTPRFDMRGMPFVHSIIEESPNQSDGFCWYEMSVWGE